MKKTFRKILASLLVVVILITAAPFSFCFNAFASEEGNVQEPVFELVKTGQSGNIITVAVNLVSGTYNTMDFRFIMSDGVKCNSISAQGGIGNPANGMVSQGSVDGYSIGTVIIATFTVPDNAAYTISGKVTHCSVTNSDNYNVLTSASVTGVILNDPVLELIKIGQNGNIITVAVNLMSGTYNMMDFRFIMSDGIICNSISAQDGIGNPASGKVSQASVDWYSIGTVIIATFTVPENMSYSISGIVSDCCVSINNIDYVITPPTINSVIECETKSIKCGENIYCYLDSATGTLLISGTGNMYDYDSWDNISPFYNHSFIKSIVLEDGVTSVGNYMFYNCYCLTSITIPASIEKIGSKAIAECDNLQTVIFESEEYIDMDSSVFLNSPNVTTLCKENSYMHYYADMENLKYCIIDDSNNPNFTVKNDILVSYNGEAENVFLSSASKIGFEAFKGNTDIKSVELANNVTRIYNSAFKNCTGLEKIILPKSVASIGDSAFTGCDSLTIWCYAGSYAEAYAVNHDIPLEYITLNLSDSRIVVADSEEITLDASFSTSMIDSGEIIWASSNPEVATVENGVVNVVDFGEAEITATTASGLSASCEIKVDLKLDSAADAVIDDDSNMIFGSDLVNKNADGIKTLFVNSRISVTDTDGSVGTGDKVSLLKADGTVYREVEVVIFGDVNGDGLYDGTDSIIVNCLANGILSREQVGEAVYMAADCNHDGVIDSADVALLEQAGIILASVDQTKTEAELMTDSAYVEYLNLINQNPTDNTTNVTPTDEPVDEGFNKSFVERLIDFIIYIVNLMKTFIAKF